MKKCEFVTNDVYRKYIDIHRYIVHLYIDIIEHNLLIFPIIDISLPSLNAATSVGVVKEEKCRNIVSTFVVEMMVIIYLMLFPNKIYIM